MNPRPAALRLALLAGKVADLESANTAAPHAGLDSMDDLAEVVMLRASARGTWLTGVSCPLAGGITAR